MELTPQQAILKAKAIDTLMDSSGDFAFERRQLVAAAMRAKQSSAGNPLLFNIESIIGDRVFQAHRGAVEYFEAHRQQVLPLLQAIFPDSLVTLGR